MSKFYDDIARGCLPTGEPLENLYGVGWWTEEDEPEPELKPCPFCVSEAGLPTNLDGTPVDYEVTDCTCKNDDCPISEYWIPIKIWQSRPIEVALRKRIAELEAENGRLQESWLWETVCPDGSLRPKVSELLLNLDGWKERSNGWESIVETLNTRIAELESAQRWIPVSERLPDNWESVLTIDISKSTRGPVTAFFNPETSLWSAHFGDLWVTHWMPLPEPPIVYGKVCDE